MATHVAIGEYTPQVPAQEGMRRIIPDFRPEPAGGAIDELANSLDTVMRARAATNAGNKLADARLRIMQAVEQAKQNAAPGADGFFGTVNGIVQQEQKAALASASNPYEKRQLQQGFNNLRVGFGDEAIKYEAVQGVEHRFNSAKDSSDKLAAIAAQRPDQYGDLMGQALAQINGSRLPSDHADEAARYAKSVISRSAVMARAQADPYATMKGLLQPEDADPAIQALTAQERLTLLQHADGLLHQRVSDAERIEAMHDKEERRNASAALTSLIVKSRSPEGVTTQDVLAKAPLFAHDPGALEAALSLASGKSVTTDVQQFAPRFAAALRGEDQSDWALAHVGKDLSKEDFEKLANLSEKGVPNAIKRGTEYIDNAMRPGPLDKWNPVLHESHANALDSYYTWTKENPNASAEQAVAQARMLVHSYSLVNLSNSRLALPLPRFVVGNRQTMDPDATAAKTLEAERAGVITHAEAAREMANISQWRKVITDAAAAPQAPK